MIRLNPKTDKLPFQNEELAQIITDIYISNQEVIENLEAEEQSEMVHIFNKKDSRVINGFSIKVIAEKNTKQEISIYYTEIIIYETEDEWFEAYNDISSKNKKV